MVYVIDKDGRPLMPTKRHGKVKWLLKRKQAKVVKRSPFTIQLTYEPKTHCIQDVALGVDAGSKHVGLSASTEKEELFSAEMTLRDDIPQLMTARRQSRRTRRNRLRYRKPRFDNRKRSDGWLTPTMEAKIRTHVNIINDICSILPVSRIIIETASFNIQKIKDEDIKGKRYQEGEQLGYANVKAYVKARDNFTCWSCGFHNHLEVHHIIRRHDGGSDRPANLITLCKRCHTDHHNGKKPLDIPFPENKGFRGATEMNTMRWFLLDRLKKVHSNVPVEQTYGYVTNWERNNLKLEKTHANDAFCIAGNFNAERADDIYDILKVRCHNRHLEKDNFRKGGKKRRNQGPRAVNGFQRFSKCVHNGKEAIVTALRSDGRFKLKYHDGTSRDKIVSRNIILVSKQEHESIQGKCRIPLLCKPRSCLREYIMPEGKAYSQIQLTQLKLIQRRTNNYVQRTVKADSASSWRRWRILSCFC